MTVTRLSFPELETRANYEIDRVNGPTNAQADLRFWTLDKRKVTSRLQNAKLL